MKPPRLTLLILATAFLAAAGGAAYGIWWNPELVFWKELILRKLAWAENMRERHGHVIGIVGGSTTLFAIDAAMLEERHDLPAVNLGIAAGFGPDVCAGLGFAALQRGDRLVVCIEPSMLATQAGPTASGTQLAAALGRPELVSWGGGPNLLQRTLNPATILPGGYHLITLLGKLTLGRPLFRYTLEDSRPGGFQVTPERRDFAEAIRNEKVALRLSHEGRGLLQRIRDEAVARGVSVAYVLPWAYADPDAAENRRESNDALLDEIGEILPVLREPQLGVHTVLADFADSAQHLTEDAARRRTEVFARTLQSWDKVTNTP